MICDIKIYGSNELRKVSKPIVEITDEIKEILNNLVETMQNVKGVGLAAPQIGIDKRMFVIDVGDGNIRKVINPKIIELSDEIESNEEGCLSIPGVYKPVKRAKYIKIEYTDVNGKVVVEEATELLARAFQHEYDHLEAILFVDRVSPVAKRMIAKKLQLLKKGHR